MLNTSARSCRPWFVAEPEVLADVIRSTCQKLGPRRKLRGRLPNVPGCGAANAAGFSQRTPSFRYGFTPGTRSGRCVPRLLPPGMLVTVTPPTVTVSGRLIVTLIGTPLRALTMPPTRQPPAQRPVERQHVDERAVERVRDVAQVRAELGVVVERVLRRRRFVRALGRPLVARVLILQAAGEAGAEAAGRADLQRVVARLAAAA